MTEELKRATQEEINKLRAIVEKGYIENEEEVQLYLKFVRIKRKLKAEKH